MDYEVVKTNNKGYFIRCSICGNEKFINKYNFKIDMLNHCGANCHENFYISYIGKVVGDYEIISYLGNYRYQVKCTKCGITSEASLRSLISNGNSFVHGIKCLKAIPNSEYKKVIMERFQNMYQRCNNPNNTNYKHYGARGIKLEYQYPVDLYLDFIDELKAHSVKYGLKNSTFDRIDVNGNYCKENLRITTQSVQSTNTTNKILFILEKENDRVICDNSMAFGREYNINGRAVGNVVRGQSKSANGWKLYAKFAPNSDINKIVETESVTTKLITT